MGLQKGDHNKNTDRNIISCKYLTPSSISIISLDESNRRVSSQQTFIVSEAELGFTLIGQSQVRRVKSPRENDKEQIMLKTPRTPESIDAMGSDSKALVGVTVS